MTCINYYYHYYCILLSTKITENDCMSINNKKYQVFFKYLGMILNKKTKNYYY